MSTPDDTRAGLGWPSEGSTADQQVAGTPAGLGWPTAHPPASTTAPPTAKTNPLPHVTVADLTTYHPEESA